MIVGPVIKAIDNATSNTTSNVLDLRNWDGLLVATEASSSFEGSIRLLAKLAGVNEEGAETESGQYLQYGGYLTPNRVERYEICPSLVRLEATITAGSLTVYVQPYQKGRI